MADDIRIIATEAAEKSAVRVAEILDEWQGPGKRLIRASCPRFGSGEGKAILPESVRDRDVYIMTDVMNSSLTYKMGGSLNRMSPDDHFQDLKRVIAACNGTARRITVIMPFLYEGRQHRRNSRESLDCGVMLRELENMNVHSIITFDAHDPRVQHAIPLTSFENVSPALQFLQMLFTAYEDLSVDREHMMIISPDEGATGRAVFIASLLGVNIGMFYKRRDYATIVDGMNPIVAHDFCGESVEGKDCIVLDDMISSGGSIIDVSRQLSERGARRVFIFTTFGLFTHGMDRFDKAFEAGWFTRLFITNLTWLKPDVFSRDYIAVIHMERYIAALIDTMSRGQSLRSILKPEERIRSMLELYKNGALKT